MPSPTLVQTSQSLEATARRLCESRGGKWSGTKGMARCPAHDDHTPSLGVTLGRHAILFHCFAGCDQVSVIDAFRGEGLPAAALFSASQDHRIESAPRSGTASRGALRIWRKATPLAGSPAKAYLEARGVWIAGRLRSHDCGGDAEAALNSACRGRGT